MKSVFKKSDFPNAPGGDRYEWKEAETAFEVPENGRYVIAITASCKDGKQRGSGDDDDLRLSINGYEFGKAETHAEMISYQGFGTSAAWDGASLKGGSKTICFFLDLDEELEKLLWFDRKKRHIIKFYADGKPKIHGIKIIRLEPKEAFFLENQKPADEINVKRKGIPWMSFIFLGTHAKKVEITTRCRSGKQKGGADGDNIKMIINGEILQNQDAPASDKYKNFFFSGDRERGKTKTLLLEPGQLPYFENSLELWYDESPTLESLRIDFFEDIDSFLERAFIDNPKKAKFFYYSLFYTVAYCWRLKKLKYAPQFLLNALKQKPDDLFFGADHPIVDQIKKDKAAYSKISNLIQKNLQAGRFHGEIILGSFPGTKIEFGEVEDLALSVHGLKKISYKTEEKEAGLFDAELTFFDVYDFDPKKYKGMASFLVNRADEAEKARVIKNFEITIHMHLTIRL